MSVIVSSLKHSEKQASELESTVALGIFICLITAKEKLRAEKHMDTAATKQFTEYLCKKHLNA